MPTFPASHRLSGPAEFAAVYDGRTRETRGPLTLYATPNDLGHPRLGLSVSRKVGIAVRRNRIKRLLREAFRLSQSDLPRGYDWVVVVRPHLPMILAEYQKLLSALTRKLHSTWQRRPPKKDAPGPPPAENVPPGKGPADAPEA